MVRAFVTGRPLKEHDDKSKLYMRRLTDTATSRTTIQTKTCILHTQVIQDSCQRSQSFLCFSRFSFEFLNEYYALMIANNCN